jgi:hypothetical protein
MKKFTLASVVTSTLLLTACGGGSSGGDSTPPIIDSISNVTIEADTTSNTIAVNATDNRSTTDNLLIGASSSNTQVVADANLQLSGSGNNTQLVITPVPDIVGTSTITVEATDEAGNTATEEFIVDVVTRQEDRFTLVNRISQLNDEDNPEFINQVSLIGEIDDTTGFDEIVDNN